MTKEELDEKLKLDSYLIARKNHSDDEIRLYLREVDFCCPICGKDLQRKRQKKSSVKLFEIAHIYPNRPTIEQYETLDGLERLGENCEAFENKIALCFDCHGVQDHHTTAKEYIELVNKKKALLRKNALHETTLSMCLEEEIDIVINNILNVTTSELVKLNYNPVEISKKFENNEALLQTKVTNYVMNYYTYINEQFKILDGKNGFLFKALCNEIKACFIKLELVSKDKSEIFNSLVNWIKRISGSSSTEACEAVCSYFVQNCEVFSEITK